MTPDMTPPEIVAMLAVRGITLRADGDIITARVHRGTMTDEIRALIREHKPALLDYLRAPAGWRTDVTPDGPIYSRCDAAETGPVWPEPPRQRETRKPRQPDECPHCRGRRRNHVPIHEGESTRSDCADCGCFVEFIRWYGTTPSRN